MHSQGRYTFQELKGFFTMEQKTQLEIVLITLAVLIASFFLDNLALSFFSAIKNSYFDYFLSWITNLLLVFIVLILMTTLFLWEENNKTWILPLWTSFIITGLLVVILKFIVARARPTDAVLFADLFVYSFPSLHAALAFSVVPILDKEFPILKWLWVIFAVIISFSRLYFGVHYLSDVIAGALLGYIVGVIVLFLRERYHYF